MNAQEQEQEEVEEEVEQEGGLSRGEKAGAAILFVIIAVAVIVLLKEVLGFSSVGLFPIVKGRVFIVIMALLVTVLVYYSKGKGIKILFGLAIAAAVGCLLLGQFKALALLVPIAWAFWRVISANRVQDEEPAEEPVAEDQDQDEADVEAGEEQDQVEGPSFWQLVWSDIKKYQLTWTFICAWLVIALVVLFH